MSLVKLPPLRESGSRGPRIVLPTEIGEEQTLFTWSAGELALLTLTVVRSRPERALPLSGLQGSTGG